MLDYTLKENATHGSNLFPIELYYNDAGFGHRILDCHWHDEIEFIYMQQGHAEFIISNITYEINEGELLIINSKDLHMAYALEHTHCIYDSIVINPDLLSSHAFDACQNKYILPILNANNRFPVQIKGAEPWEKEIILIVLEIMEQLNNKAFAYELFVKSSLLRIVAILFNKHSIQKASKDSTNNDDVKSERIRKTLAYMSLHYKQSITIDTLAEELNLSKYYFCRLFKNVTGRTPLDYLNFYRINKAIALLGDQNIKISQVGIDVGFDNFSYFSKTFKHYTGHTPSEFKEL